MHIKQELTERHVLTLTVDNEAGTLARIAGMFTSRGYNIDSLTVADISEDHTTSRITIVTGAQSHGPDRSRPPCGARACVGESSRHR
jgi:acetolactate synthase-1/3 small subunit